MPPTELIVRVGRFVSGGVLAGATGPSVVDVEAEGFVVPRVQVAHSMRIRPGPPTDVTGVQPGLPPSA